MQSYPCADRVGLRQCSRKACCSHDDGIVRCRRQFAVDDLGGACKHIAYRTVHVWNGAQTQGILGAPAGAGSQDGAPLEKGTQPGAGRRERGRGAQLQRLRIEGRQLAVQVFECHRGSGIGPLEQTLRASQRKRGQTGDAGRTVHQAQTLLRLQSQRLNIEAPQRLGPGPAAAMVAHEALAKQHERDVCHVREIPD